MSMALSSTGAPHDRITVRRMDFDFTPDIPENWGNGNPMVTALMAGFSAVFPPGERYFIESVRHYADRVTDPDLKERIRGFIGQEANHTKEHIAFNKFIAARGLPIEKLERFVEARLKYLQQRSSPAANLARTAALEHMTAFLASALLDFGDFLEHTHPTVAAFWMWHAIEEIEHRSVAFDVYKEYVDDEWLRVRSMATVTLIFCAASAVRTGIIMKKTGNLFNVPAWAGGLDMMFGRQGVLRKALPLYYAYFRRDFHPDQHDNRAALERAKSKYLRGATP
jgi:predicted metal-dependent hydrolase